MEIARWMHEKKEHFGPLEMYDWLQQNYYHPNFCRLLYLRCAESAESLRTTSTGECHSNQLPSATGADGLHDCGRVPAKLQKLALAVSTNQTAETVAAALWKRFILFYGYLTQLHSDQGAFFKGKLIDELCQLYQIRKTRTTCTTHKETVPERMNWTVLQMLQTLVEQKKEHWLELAWWASMGVQQHHICPTNLFLNNADEGPLFGHPKCWWENIEGGFRNYMTIDSGPVSE